jgi:tetratricopeptide (TPR) repeat protein
MGDEILFGVYELRNGHDRSDNCRNISVCHFGDWLSLEGILESSAMGTIRTVFVGAVLLTATLLAQSAVAQTSQQIGWCTSSGTPDQTIEGCTAMIKSKEYQGEKLAGIYNRRAVAYALKKDYDRAIEDYGQSILNDISNTDVMYNRGIAYAGKGDYDRAIADISRAIAGFNSSRYPPDYKRDYFKARGNAYRGKNDFDHAIADYNEAIRLDPNYARAYYNRGEAKQKTGDTAGGDADIALAKQLQINIGPEE